MFMDSMIAPINVHSRIKNQIIDMQINFYGFHAVTSSHKTFTLM